MASIERRLQLIEEAVAGADRYKDICLVLRRAKTKETLLYAGGKWDKLTLGYSSEEPDQVAVIELEESQVEFTVWFEKFLADYRDGFKRDISSALIAGDRRAGKTFDVYFCQIGALIEVPIVPNVGMPSLGWTVSKTFRERDELDQLIAGYIPADWYRAQKAPEHRYDFIVGSALRNLSADDPDSLKQGRVDWLLYNEVQKMQARAVVNGLYGTADQGGICLMTANKPSERDTRGEWLFDVKEAIDDEVKAQAKAANREPLGIVFFNLSSKQNTKIDQPARRRVARLAAIIDPTTAEADDDDSGTQWKRPGDRAAWEFDKHRHLHAKPVLGIVDCTRKVAQNHWYGQWDYIAGVDFQGKPHIASVMLICYGDPDAPIYHYVDELVEARVTEPQFLEVLEEQRTTYTRDNLLWIGDASGSWQDGKHNHDGEFASFDYFEGDGRVIIQPQEAKGKTGRGRNPFVDERLQLFNELLRKDRIRVDPVKCPWFVECLREATTKRDTGRRKLVANKYAHAIDAGTYPIWRLEKRPGGPRIRPEDVRIVKSKLRGG